MQANLEFNNDILYNLMLKSNDRTLKYLSSANRKTVDYSHHKQFWIDKLQNDNLPYIPNMSLKNYKLLQEAADEADMMILLNEICNEEDDHDESIVDKYNLNGEGVIRIEFNYALSDDQEIRSILPIDFEEIHQSYPDYEIAPNEISLIKIHGKYRLDYFYEIVIRDDIKAERVEISKEQLRKILIFFMYHAKSDWYNIKFKDMNDNQLTFENAPEEYKTIMKVIKNIQLKNIKI